MVRRDNMRLIDGNTLRDEVLYDNTYDNDIVNYYLWLIDDAPTIDPVRRSHWNGWTTSAYMGWQDEFGNPVYADRKFYRCDNCRHGSAIKHNFCPSCGARMGGDPK